MARGGPPMTQPRGLNEPRSATSLGRLTAAWAALALLASLGACRSDTAAVAIEPPASPYQRCVEGATPKGPEVAACRSYRLGRVAGLVQGRREADTHIANETRGGYRLRRITSLSLGGLAGLLCGTLLGAWLVARLKRKRWIPHGEHLFSQLDAEASGVRQLAHGSPGRPVDAVVASAVQQLSLAVAEVERHGRRICERCAALEHARGDAVDSAHLQGLYHRLDDLVVLVSRIRIRVGLWVERRGSPDRAAVEDEVTQILTSLEAAEQELDG